MKPIKFYVAASFPRRAEAAGFATKLRDIGHVVTSRWHGHCFNDPAKDAQQDVEDCLAAEWMVQFTDPYDAHLSRGGRHTELGIFIGLNRPVVLIGDAEQIFHYLPQVIKFQTEQEVLQWLTDAPLV